MRAAAGGVDDDRVARPLKTSAIRAARAAALLGAGRRGGAARRSTAAPRGATTSQPSAASTRAVAAFTLPKTTRWTQPSSSPTRMRLSPTCGVSAGGRSDERHGGFSAANGFSRPGQPRRRQRERRAQPARLRDGREDHPALQPLAERAAVVLLDVRAGLLDQRPVLDARGARRHAGHAAEAAVEVLDDRVGELQRPVDEPVHQVDPPARRVHLLLPERPVGRARRQAEAAVDAVGDQLLRDLGHTSTPAGSNCARTRSASATSPGSRGSSTSPGT